MDEEKHKEETAGTKSQEYYWEQEKQLFAIRRFFYEHNLLPEGDSYFPNDVIKAAESFQAENEQLKWEIKGLKAVIQCTDGEISIIIKEKVEQAPLRKENEMTKDSVGITQLEDRIEKLGKESHERLKIIEQAGWALGMKYPSENRECIVPRINVLKAKEQQRLDAFNALLNLFINCYVELRDLKDQKEE